ncbi:DUF3450 domain-containing protein [Endozoicomonas ascidiicola]|uniref:DUF3450 domain-containing protein n=1 Tax=Endozoicomonas ascidiicola TaxID=1698521 RepID=UPI0008297C2C|nr:DUF3450 domain-containing protein [Endozoicomonas ascidiicola]
MTRRDICSRTVGWLLSTVLCYVSFANATVQELTQLGEQRIKAGQSAQLAIESLDDETRQLESQWFHLMKKKEGIDVYNRVLQQQLAKQQAEIADIKQSIAETADVERQIIPLISRMIRSLEQFIALDMPFLLSERQQRVAELKSLLNNPGTSTSEKLARTFAAYQEESRYGKTIETYPGEININNQLHQVDFLRIGRVAFLYQTSDRSALGAWNAEQAQWVQLPVSDYQRHFVRGVEIASKKAAPDMLTIPLFHIDTIIRPILGEQS